VTVKLNKYSPAKHQTSLTYHTDNIITLKKQSVPSHQCWKCVTKQHQCTHTIRQTCEQANM